MECGGLAAAFEADPRLVAYENLATNTIEPFTPFFSSETRE